MPLPTSLTRVAPCALLLCVSLACSDKPTTPGAAAGTSAGGDGTSGSGGDSSAGSGGAAGNVAVAGTGGDAGGGAGGQGGSAGGAPLPPAAYLTTSDLSQGLAVTPLNLGEVSDAGAILTLDPSTTFQVMTGFGASITDSSSYVMTKYLADSALKDAMVKLFDPVNGVGLSFLRQPMGASDFSSVGNFSYDDTAQDVTLTHFNIDQDMKATVPLLKQSRALNPSLFILGTPWSPPAWMKNNASMNGSGSGASGNPGLALTAYAPLAQYFVKFVQAYAAQGIVVNAITPQNEPQNGAAAYPGMDLNAASELKLIGTNLGPAFKAAGLSTLIWAFDHNWDHEDYPEQVMADATANGFSEGAAFHCYGGDPSAMTTFHQKFPQKSIYMTECSGGDWQDSPWSNGIELAISSVANYAQAVVFWNLALDENHGPTNNGCPGCRGLITVNSKTKDVKYEVDYFALGHFSKFVLPGARRIGSMSSNPALHQVAFANKDGRLAVVAHNTGKDTLSVQIGSGATAMNVSVPANAAVTVAWTPGS